MIKLKDLLPEDWKTDMSKDAQDDYKDEHPKSKIVFDPTNPSGKKERDDDGWMENKDGWEILDDERSKVKKTRDYTDEEYEDETGEYFGNSDVIAPGLASSDEELIDKMKNSPTVYLSSEEMQDMNNTDVGEILDASEEGGSEAMKGLGKQKAKEYKKDWDRLEKGIESLDEPDSKGVPPPIVIRDKNGELHLMAGNTRMMSFTAHGKKLPVKIIDYDGEFDYDEWERVQKEKEEKK